MKSLNYKLVFIAVLCLVSCKNNSTVTLEHLNGYWEIESVTLADGTHKQYNFNDTIDYISLTDSVTGYRKKLKPLIDGTFETSKNVESFSIKREHDSVNLYYQTPFDSWKETLLLVTKDHLKVVNQNQAVFLYKRYQPFEIN